MSQHKREEWQKLQEEVLARSPGTGGLTLENLRECSGLELFQKMIAGEFPRPPISDTLGFCLVEAEKGRVVFQGSRPAGPSDAPARSSTGAASRCATSISP